MWVKRCRKKKKKLLLSVLSCTRFGHSGMNEYKKEFVNSKSEVPYHVFQLLLILSAMGSMNSLIIQYNDNIH